VSYEAYVVHCKRSRYDVYVGRPGPWGNPFKVTKDVSREEAIAKFRKWFLARPEMVDRCRRLLKGKILGCWCSPEKCHAEVLAEVANGPV